MLNSPFYVGIMRIKKTGQDFSGNHTPLISRELFDRVQTLLRGKTVDRVVRHRLLFSRLVRCGSCRYSLIGERQQGHAYYRCHNRPFKIPSVCPKTTIREEQLEDAVVSVLETLTLSDAELQYLREWIAEHRLHAAEECEEKKRVMKLQLESLRTRLGRLTDLLLDGSLEKTVFEEKQKAYVWEETRLKQKLAALESGGDNVLKQIEKVVELVKSPSLLYKQANSDGKRELLRILVSNLSASVKNVSVELTIPFRLIAERDKTSYGGPYRETCRTWIGLLKQLHSYFSEYPAAMS